MDKETERLLNILEGDEAADVVDNVRAFAVALRRLEAENDRLKTGIDEAIFIYYQNPADSAISFQMERALFRTLNPD